MCVDMWMCKHDKTKIPDRNDLKLGTTVVLDSLSKPVDISSKGQGQGHRVAAWPTV